MAPAASSSCPQEGLSGSGRPGASNRPRKQGPSPAAGSGTCRKVLRGLHCGSTVTWLTSPGRAHARTHNCTPLGAPPSHPTSLPSDLGSDTRWRAQPPEAENIGAFLKTSTTSRGHRESLCVHSHHSDQQTSRNGGQMTCPAYLWRRQAAVRKTDEPRLSFNGSGQTTAPLSSNETVSEG